MSTQLIFKLEDKIMRQPGLYAMWTGLFIANLAALLTDNTQGVSRDFNITVNMLSLLYGSFASWNNIFGNKKPSTMLLTAGPIHQYGHWLLFGYYGGSDVLGGHPIGVMNWVSVVLVGLFTADMVFKTWYLAFVPDRYRQYIAEEAGEAADNQNA
jgi:hypothetical protein